MADETKQDLRRRKGEEDFMVNIDVAKEAANLTNEEINRREEKRKRKLLNRDKVAKELGETLAQPATKIVKTEQQVVEASVDELTGLLNRKAVTAKLARELTRSKRNEEFLTLALVDLDSLKEINDGEGRHAAGDEAIIGLAKLLNGSRFRRNFDFAGRWGGDEFILILPASDLGDMVEKLNETIEEYSQQEFGKNLSRPFHSTVSIGAVEFNPRKNQSLDELVKSADRALYASKDQGGDQLAVTVTQESSLIDDVVLFEDFKAEVARENLSPAKSG